MTALGRLDVHAHYPPEPSRQALERAGHSRPDLDGAGDPPGALTEALRANTERLFPRLAAG